MKQGVIFDLDGTLWDSVANVAKAWDEVVQELNPALGRILPEDIRGLFGLSMDIIAVGLFPTLSREEAVKLLDICCARENEYLEQHGGNLYPGLESMLKELQVSYKLFIVSNCQSGYIEGMLRHYGFEHYFTDFECYGNANLPKAENIKRIIERNRISKAVYIGDIQGDYDSAVKAGVPFIHAAYGFGTINELVPRAESVKDLIPLIKEILV